MKTSKRLGTAAAITAAAAAITGLMTVPASAAVAYCGDSSARRYDLYSTDDGVRGAGASGYVAVTPDPYGPSGTYRVCLGWPTTELRANVKDRDGDGFGAIAYVQYRQFTTQNGWVTHSWLPVARADGEGAVSYYEEEYRQVADFYVRVCRINYGARRDCSGLG